MFIAAGRIARAVAVFAAAAMSACAHHAAGSAECVAKPVAQLELSFQDNTPVADVVFGGYPIRVMIDLGSQSSFVSENFSQRHKLKRTAANMQRYVGVGGFSERMAAQVDQVELGDLRRHDQRLEVLGMPMGGGLSPVEGIVGLDILRDYDIDLDLPHARMTLNTAAYCDGPPPGWDAPATAVSVEHRNLSARHMMMPVTLNGRALTALLDSGASITMIGTPSAQDAIPIPGITDSISFSITGFGENAGSVMQEERIFQFHSIVIAGETILNPDILVGAVSPLAGDMILGADFLHQHRVWIPADSNTIWFGPRAIAAKVATAP